MKKKEIITQYYQDHAALENSYFDYDIPNHKRSLKPSKNKNDFDNAHAALSKKLEDDLASAED